MNTVAAALVAGSALTALGLGALLLRRSFAGMLVGFVLGVLGVVLLTVTLFTLTGTAGGRGQVIALVLVTGAVAAAVLLLALHLAAARAGRRAEDLEPW